MAINPEDGGNVIIQHVDSLPPHYKCHNSHHNYRLCSNSINMLVFVMETVNIVCAAVTECWIVTELYLYLNVTPLARIRCVPRKIPCAANSITFFCGFP